MSRSKRVQFIRNPDVRKGVVGIRTGMLLAQCLGLAVACAKGEQLDNGPVQRITLPTPDASVPHDSGDQGSGGRVGTGGTVVMGSGGAPLGTGGSSTGGSSPGKGGSSGASAGGAVSSGGAKATGGAPATGGMASGGAQASGGSASGGLASGGASGAGGKATGGSAGAAGAGGGENCPGYVTNDACSQCICKNCKTQVDACFNSSDTTKNMQCKAIQDCAQSKHCASSPCYCTQPPTDPLCLNPDGPCVAPILAAAPQGASSLTVQQLGNDSTSPIGRANNIGKCSNTSCKTECQLP